MLDFLIKFYFLILRSSLLTFELAYECLHLVIKLEISKNRSIDHDIIKIIVGTTGLGYPRYQAKLLALDLPKQGTMSGACHHVLSWCQFPLGAGSRVRHVPISALRFSSSQRLDLVSSCSRHSYALSPLRA
jgi:hypothetical protein